MQLRYVPALFILALFVACGGDDDDNENGNGNGNGEQCVPSFTPAAPDAAASEEACHTIYDPVCARAFADCSAEFATYAWADEADCLVDIGALICAADEFGGMAPDDAAVSSCESAVTTSSCADLFAAFPDNPEGDPAFATCESAIAPVPPSPGGSATIAEGATAGAITGAEAKSFGAGKAVTYGLCLSAGDTVDLSVAAAASGDSIEDSVVALVSPSGEVVAINDDADESTLYSSIEGYAVPASGSYLAVVSTFDAGDTGAFVLTVTVR